MHIFNFMLSRFYGVVINLYILMHKMDEIREPFFLNANIYIYNALLL